MDNNSASPMAIGALVAAILGCLGCNALCFIPAIAAIVLGKMELGKIDTGESAEAGRTFAKVGMILGIVQIILNVLIGIVYAILMAVGAVGGF
jgi:hypothetical protein